MQYKKPVSDRKTVINIWRLSFSVRLYLKLVIAS